MPSIIASEMELCGIPVPKCASTAELRKFAHAVVMAAGGYNAAAHVLEVGAGTLWNLINETQQDSPTLRKRWAIRKTAQRSRVWMRTDNLEKATGTFKKYYPGVKILREDE
jgi:hypothetical protein